MVSNALHRTDRDIVVGPAGTTGRGGRAGGGEATDDATSNATNDLPPTRGEMVGLALQIDAMVARSEEMGLDLVAYLLGVARAELGERLGERPRAGRAGSGARGAAANGDGESGD